MYIAVVGSAARRPTCLPTVPSSLVAPSLSFYINTLARSRPLSRLALAAAVVDATSSPGDSCGEMSPGAASHGHPFVISLCLFFPSASLYTPPSLPLSVSPFAPASPLRRPNPLYTQQTPLPPSIYPSDADDYSALVSRKRTLSVTILRLTFARTHENSIDALAPRFSLLAFLRDGCLSRVFVVRISFRLSLSFSFSPRFSVSQTPRSFLASAESPPTGVTTIDYRRVWGRPGGGCARKKGDGGGAGLREDGIIAIHGSRRHNPTIRRLYNSGSVWGDAANIAFSVAFLSCVPLRLFLLFFFSGLSRRYRRPPVNPGCPAATRQRCGELAGPISFLESVVERRRNFVPPPDTSVPLP